MPSEKPQINARVTDTVMQSFNEVMAKLELTKAETIRLAIIELCKKHGIKVEDDMPERGKYER